MGFIDAFKRWRLAQKGMSSGKKRRTSAGKASSVDQSLSARLLVYVAFILGMFLLSVGAPQDSVLANSEYPATLIIIALALVAVLVLNLNYGATSKRSGRSLLALGTVLIQVCLVRLLVEVVDVKEMGASYKVLLAPYVLSPLLLAVLLNRRVGVYGTIMSGILGALFMPLAWLLPFIVISFSTGIVVTYIAQDVRKRGRLLRAGLYGGLVVLVFAFGFEIIGSGGFTSFQTPGMWEPIAIKCGAALGIGFFIALIISGLMPVIEGIFSLTTEISWLELSDLNHKLLRQMQLEAPGTFHHSLVVASLAEAAAEKIGANAPMCRVCAYFHDIGKLNKPEYFIENQGSTLNPHDTLTPTMSALVIVAHVKDGVDLAVKHSLNPRIIDVIKEHHGDSLVYYFYHKARERQAEEEEFQGSEKKDDLPEINEKNFRYPGPRPRSVESGIISLADACESASRSLKKPTPAKIRSLVDELVMKRVSDGQLDSCQLTLKDLKKIRESFTKPLQSTLHSRIEYPKDEEGTSRGKKKTAKKKTSLVTTKIESLDDKAKSA